MNTLKNFKQFKKELKTHLTEEDWKKIEVYLDGEEVEVTIPHQTREGWNFRLSAPEFYARRAAQLIKISLGRPK